VPLDEFKTQVLLLHSEQSTLDNLSSGFGDGFTVHCATSGSEALNTLGDTPINVIVTAQKLPGMSGLEALREAKKRSPETIGILLAEGEAAGFEALVGDKEVFQVVRGNVTGDSISKLVENATQQMRLMALASSANDAAADVDEPSAEHIIMETSENGSTIISDGTGTMPILDPKKVAAASAVGSHAVDLLVLTKDDEFLETIKDSSRGTHSVRYANTLAQADELIRKHKVGVAVVDAAMVGEKLEQLTAHLRKGSPRLVSIVAGRRDDGEMMMDLINRGKVYRFLLKPVSPGRARLAVEASVKHHLEAPDAAFKMKGPAQAAAAAPHSKPKPAPVAAPKPEPKAEPKPPGSATKPAATVSKDKVDPPFGSGSQPSGESPNDDALAEAFGGGDSSFTETVTGLFATVSKKFTPDGSAEDSTKEKPPAKNEPAPVAASAVESALQDPKMLGMGAAAIVIVAGALFWLFSGSDEIADPASQATETPIVTEAENPPEPDTVVDSSSIEAESAAVEVRIDEVITNAESALLESRIDDASAALELLGREDPENERLPFLTAQLAQIQYRTYLIDARSAIRDGRYEDASNAVAAARSLNLPDSTEVDAADLELTVAQDAKQTDEVLALASTRLNDGDLLQPQNDNARYFYELALSRDPNNVAARQGLSAIASKLAMQARTATDNGDLDAAEALLVESSSLDPDNSELDTAIAALADKRAAISAERRQAEARRQAAAEKRAADARAEAEREAEAQRAAAAAAAAAAVAAAVPVKEASTLAEEQPAATNDDNASGDGVGASEETAAVAASANTGNPAANLQPASSATVNQGPTPTTVSELNRTKYVAPKYPRAAQRRNLSGWVDIIFTVDRAGLVKDISVRDSQPGETFIASATRAVEKWEFEPVIENGQAVEKRVGVRMMFALE
jgi:TonB family protein